MRSQGTKHTAIRSLREGKGAHPKDLQQGSVQEGELIHAALIARHEHQPAGSSAALCQLSCLLHQLQQLGQYLAVQEGQPLACTGIAILALLY